MFICIKKLFCLIFVTTLIFVSLPIKSAESAYAIWSYKGSSKVVKTQRGLPYKLAILTFTDERPDIEHSHKARVEAGIRGSRYYTDDSYIPKADVDKEITRWLVSHIKAAGLFRFVERQDITSEDYYKGDIDWSKLDKFDYVLVGKIRHLFGFVDGINEKEKSVAKPLLALIAETAENAKLKDNPIEAHVQFTDLRLIDIKTQEIIWQGEVEKNINEVHKDFIVATEVANMALKDVFDELVPQIEEAILKHKGKEGVRSLHLTR